MWTTRRGVLVASFGLLVAVLMTKSSTNGVARAQSATPGMGYQCDVLYCKNLFLSPLDCQFYKNAYMGCVKTESSYWCLDHGSSEYTPCLGKKMNGDDCDYYMFYCIGKYVNPFEPGD